VAASTRGNTIRLQPTDTLRDAGTLESTLRHELLHMLVESHAKPGTPLWFREGLVLYLTKPHLATNTDPKFGNVDDLNKALRNPASEEQLRQAYAEAQARVAKMAREHGNSAMVDWLQNGLPAL